MSGHLLIIDPIATNRIVLKVKLASAFYSAAQAASIAQAVALARKTPPDAVIMDACTADGGVAELRAALRTIPGPKPLPVLVLTTANCPQERAEALAAGATDAASKPVNDAELMARIRALLRPRSIAEEFSMPPAESTIALLSAKEGAAAPGFCEPPAAFARKLKVALVTDNPAQAITWKGAMAPYDRFTCDVCSAEDALASRYGAQQGKEQPPDAYVIEFSCADPGRAARRLALITELHSRASNRSSPILIVAQSAAAEMAATGLDVGAGDMITGGFEPTEVAMRLSNLIHRHAREVALRRSLQARLDEALIDPLTGLYNRRFALPHLTRVAQLSRAKAQSYAVLALDLDHFKQVNDAHGHGAGDAVLAGFADRLMAALGENDIAARIGGEEFLVILPNTDAARARQMAERIRSAVAACPFEAPATARSRSAHTISISLSAGLAVGRESDLVEEVLARADAALYWAKAHGRNQVVDARDAA